MIDFFNKRASLTKRITGIAKMKGAPVVHARKPRKVSDIGTFFDEEHAVVSILLEVAETPEEKKVGLMGRDDIPDVCGMLFKDLSGGGTFWMKGCLVPIDVAFIDGDGKITKTYSMEVDKGRKRYEYGDEDTSAVEVRGGFMKKFGIKPGFVFKSRKLESVEDGDGKQA
jgi:uncharacterized membrane protein (UPF0127 family)